MTADLEDIGIEWLIYSVPKTRNSAALIEHLRQNGKVTPELKNLIADILGGKIKAKAKPKVWKDILTITDTNGSTRPSVYLVGMLAAYQRMLRSPSVEKWDQTKNLLKVSGYVGTPESKGEITKAAKKILAHSFGITGPQLDELLSPRKARAKHR